MKICILGAGVLGVTTAYELGRRGHEVTVIERQHEPARECSYANGGQLSYAHAEPWANPGVFPKLFKWAFQDDAPIERSAYGALGIAVSHELPARACEASQRSNLAAGPVQQKEDGRANGGYEGRIPSSFQGNSPCLFAASIV